MSPAPHAPAPGTVDAAIGRVLAAEAAARAAVEAASREAATEVDAARRDARVILERTERRVRVARERHGPVRGLPARRFPNPGSELQVMLPYIA